MPVEPEWLPRARELRSEVPRRSMRYIAEELGVGQQAVTYWLVKRERQGRGSQRGPTEAGRRRMGEARRGEANPSFKDGERVGERAGKRRFKSADLMCQAPGCLKRGAHDHHVVYRQELRKRGLGEWNPRNAMKLCHSCHSSHHARGRVLPLTALSDEHIAYAFEILAAFAHDYLKRRYAGPDARVERQLELLEAAA